MMRSLPLRLALGNHLVVTGTSAGIAPVRHLIATGCHQLKQSIRFARRCIPFPRIGILSPRPCIVESLECVPALSQVVAGFDCLGVRAFLKLFFQLCNALRTIPSIIAHTWMPGFKAALPCAVRPGLTGGISRIILLHRFEVMPVALRPLQIKEMLCLISAFAKGVGRFAVSDDTSCQDKEQGHGC